MVKSMFSGVAGLRTHQAKMDIIGNNIANVNTWGFKAGSMSFKDTMYQNTSSGSAGNTDAGGYGGTNANQVGYGVTTGSVSYDFSTGGMSPSSRALDCMIDGSGFFIVGPMLSNEYVDLSEDNAVTTSGLYLSRVGQFKVDNDGYLVDDGGNYVYGFQNTNTADLTTGTFNTTTLSPIKIPTNAELATMNNGQASSAVTTALKTLAEAKTNLNTLTGNLATARDAYVAAKSAYDAAYESLTVKDKATAVTDTKKAMEDAYSVWEAESTDLNKQADYYAAKLAYDEANYEYAGAMASLRIVGFDNTTDLEPQYTAYETAMNTYITALRAGTATTTEQTAMQTALTALETAEKALTGIETGSLEETKTTAEQAAKKASALVDAATLTVTNAEKNLAAAQSASTTTSVSNSDADDEIAKLTNFKVQQDGTLVGTTEDGKTIVIGKVALAGVQNTDGLEKSSGYYYSIGPNAGNVSIYEAGGTEGRILGNYLEMATVDLATEMTSMITTQRGFQANSKIITVTDQMLEELVNMKR